ncbi:unnamed protein product (macronuclear) [Paramecium tetraurelia]|uniref:Uncharacterized protein n=1 Tax=Paramecium tetraurelia TaxID=5888 RepID=A0BLY5_PARTE|nr:uncharacterized protein GSPATT00030186001 [Paramecium tetraurelia]CAK59552.1 unnamed protein product [Paramecium tetraurelia]|eukprot:XP_001426950.1 hypothetical protein (macronuclear) [Paramecium tetraurelia strain d4-2]
MQELEEFLEKQKDLNINMLTDILQTQSLIQHNLSIGLDSLKKCIENLPTKIVPKQGLQSRITIHRQNQHQFILSQLNHKNFISYLNLEEEIKEIYRDRMFNLSVSLRDMNGDLIQDEDCPIFLRIYTSEKFPKEVDSNIRGKPIFKGQTKILFRGKGEFQRISITEVSSHFPSGKFLLVIFSEKSYIKPYIIDNLIVKAKKLLK